MPPPSTDTLHPSSPAQRDSTTANLTPEQAIQREKKVPKKGKEEADKVKKSLQSSLSDLQSQTTLLEAQIAETKAKLKNDPSTTVKQHIRLLHDYNEIKDIGQGLMGLIADARGVRQIEVQREFGVGDGD